MEAASSISFGIACRNGTRMMIVVGSPKSSHLSLRKVSDGAKGGVYFEEGDGHVGTAHSAEGRPYL
jgi:hypothetical protein